MDLCAVTEAWVKADDTCLPKEIPPPDYKIISTPRASYRPGGGVALIYKTPSRSMPLHIIYPSSLPWSTQATN